jgi:hypothetical protein
MLPGYSVASKCHPPLVSPPARVAHGSRGTGPCLAHAPALVADPNVSMASTLARPLRGGANEEVLKMLEEIGSTDAAGEGSRPIHVSECLKFPQLTICSGLPVYTDDGLRAFVWHRSGLFLRAPREYIPPQEEQTYARLDKTHERAPPRNFQVPTDRVSHRCGCLLECCLVGTGNGTNRVRGRYRGAKKMPTRDAYCNCEAARILLRETV